MLVLNEITAFYHDYKTPKLLSDFLKKHIDRKCVLLCIGTDKYIGDCLGPITGTFLSKLSLNCPVYGTLENPVHAVNLKEKIWDIHSKYPKYSIIAIDACLGSEDAVGSIQIKKGCLQPGKGVGKNLPSVGDISIVGVVNKMEAAGDMLNFYSMHNIRLNLVMKMSETITKSIFDAFSSGYR